MPNMTAINFDPKIWQNPEHFNPDRFLDDEGNLMKYDSFIPFSIGNYSLLYRHYFLTFLYQNRTIITAHMFYKS